MSLSEELGTLENPRTLIVMPINGHLIREVLLKKHADPIWAYKLPTLPFSSGSSERVEQVTVSNSGLDFSKLKAL